MKPLEILAIVYSARSIAKRFDMANKQKCANAYQMTEDELESYKNNKAIFNVKIIGLVVSIPGLVLFILTNR